MTYHIRLEPGGKAFEVEPGQAILTAGLDAGIRMPYGCRMGTCRSCRGRITSGNIDFGAAHPAYLPQHQRDEGYALLCQASACSDLTIEIEELPVLAKPEILPAIIKKITRRAPDVAVVALRLPLHSNMQFAAGQYVDFLLPGGTRRSYSIACPVNPAGVIDLEFHIRHLPGGVFTERLFGGMKERDKVQFEGPLGSFLLRDSDKPALFIASGTGYAPIRSILMSELPKRGARKMALYWGGRARKDLYLLDEAAQWAREYENFSFVPVLSEAPASDEWTGATGFVHVAAMQDLKDLSGWQVYACGVPVMVDAAQRDFVAQCGLPEAEFYSDAFVSMADIARLDAN
jgi:CDP-4-dehydro-6-deoxyglucose reductase, E3